MEEQFQPILLEDHSLEEIVQFLMAGAPVYRTREEDFCLDTDDKRKVFAFYYRNRQLWPSKKNVQSTEVESLLQALEDNLPTTIAQPQAAAAEKPVWHLERVAIHRFGGLHRHIGPNGEDPEDFIFDLTKEITLVSGFNGAGKSALLSAIVWCLTGKALRSQHMPREVHQPIPVDWSTEDEETYEGGDAHPDIAIPPIVPVPTAEDLSLLGDMPKLDTRVQLDFRRENSGEVCRVSRRLERSGKKFSVPVEGLDFLGLPSLAIEAGTLMPGVAAHMRFDEKTDLAQAVSQLTGLKPLQELGLRTERLLNRLRDKEKQAKEKARDEKFDRFKIQHKTLKEGWEEHSDLGEFPKILLPGEVIEVSEDQSASESMADCQSTLAAARTRLKEMKLLMSHDIETILGQKIEFSTQREVDSMVSALDNAAVQISGKALQQLPSIGTLSGIGQISDEDAAIAANAIQDVCGRAQALSSRLEDERQAVRWRLYARVASWHRESHPDEDFSNCPICGSDLENVPDDALLDISVKAALDQCRRTDSDVAKTSKEWERDESAAFLDALPVSVRGYADMALPGTLLALCHKGYVEELLGQEAFSGRLRPLQEKGSALWALVTSEVQLPVVPRSVESNLPTLLAGGKLQKRVTAIARVLMMRAHRENASDAFKLLLSKYIGTVKIADDVAERSTEDVALQFDKKERELEQAPRREQIKALRRAAQNTLPIISLIRQIEDLETVRVEWNTHEYRLSLLRRAADAVEPYLIFPELVYERVSGLIEMLDRDTGNWLGKIYRPHYLGGPSYGGFEPDDDGKFGLRAGIGNMRVPAHQIMNASLLRACIWAFLFAFWEHVRKHSGCISSFLLDDPQTHFDPINSENLAAVFPQMPQRGMRPLIASNDVRFVASVQDKLPSSASDSLTWTAQRLDPISSSKLTASLSPSVEEIREKRDRWREDENNVPKAQDFVECVRVDIENRLWNLLATDPLVLHSPTLADLLGQLRHARNGGERPFEEPPFEKLLSHQALRHSHIFYKIINKAHHQLVNITPQDAADVHREYESVHSILRSCTAAYARFLGRLTNEDRSHMLADAPVAPAPAIVPNLELPVLGELAARSNSDILAIERDQEQFQLSSLGDIALYVIRGSTFGTLALPGQIAIVSLEREAEEGETAIALYQGKAFARRIHRDRKDLSRTLLVSDLSGSENVPPSMLVPTTATRAMPIIGVLYDTRTVVGRDEAVVVESSDTLTRNLAVARIVEDSAYPVIRNGDLVLIEEIGNISRSEMDKLEERIVAVTARSDGESFGYLKRLGQEIGNGVRIYENIGLNGQAVPIAESELLSGGRIHCLERLWRVHGFLRGN
ncbi:MAG: ATP-binding protein [Rhodospirillaceae bacterium]|nr:ATP-binding protein [Rhodospirillaceae bacterium]MDE0619649.1 ATP-binding protein [Rhodospirillaceae bacterium]